MNTLSQIRLIWKPLVFLACLLPLAHVVGDAFGFTGTLGANPVEEILDRFGNWGLRFIMITLAVTPLRRLTGWNSLARFRRMLGLFTFFYVLLHFLTWLLLDQGLLLSAILEDIAKRPFITIGFAALLLLIALAATSTHGPDCDPRRLALLVAGETGHHGTCCLRCNSCHVAWIPSRLAEPISKKTRLESLFVRFSRQTNLTLIQQSTILVSSFCRTYAT